MTGARPRLGAGLISNWRLSLLVLGLALSGCQGTGGPRTSRCVLDVGMDTDQLALCGCVSADTRGDYRVPLSSESERNAGVSVSVINYMCPLGRAGVAKVVVINGTARRILF